MISAGEAGAVGFFGTMDFNCGQKTAWEALCGVYRARRAQFRTTVWISGEFGISKAYGGLVGNNTVFSLLNYGCWC